MNNRLGYVYVVASVAIFIAYVVGIAIGRIGYEHESEYQIPCGPSEVAVWDEYPENIACVDNTEEP